MQREGTTDVHSFTGDFDGFKEQVAEIVASPEAHGEHKFRRPWWIESWKIYNKRIMVNKEKLEREDVAGPQDRITWKVNCMRHANRHEIKVGLPLTVVMLLGSGLMDRDAWNVYESTTARL